MAEIMQCYYEKDARLPFNVQAIGKSYCDWSYYSKRENSDVCSIEYCLEGTGKIVCNGKEYFPKGGDVWIIKTGDCHVNTADRNKPWRKLWFTVYGHYVSDLLYSYGIENVVVFNDANCRGLFERVHELSLTDITYESLCTELATIIQQLIHSLTMQCREKTAVSAQSAAIRDYLNKHVYERLSLDSVSKEVFLSVSQIIRIFKKNFHVSPYEYLMEKKIEAAKVMLKNSNLNIKQVAEKLSFSDEHYFSNFFYKKVGIRPSEYIYI